MMMSEPSRFHNLAENLKTYIQGLYPEAEAIINHRQSELGFAYFAFEDCCNVTLGRRKIGFNSGDSRRINESITLEIKCFISTKYGEKSLGLMAELRNWLDQAFECWLQSLGLLQQEEEFIVKEFFQMLSLLQNANLRSVGCNPTLAEHCGTGFQIPLAQPKSVKRSYPVGNRLGHCMKLTFIDTGVLIAAARGQNDVAAKACRNHWQLNVLPLTPLCTRWLIQAYDRKSMRHQVPILCMHRPLDGLKRNPQTGGQLLPWLSGRQ